MRHFWILGLAIVAGCGGESPTESELASPVSGPTADFPDVMRGVTISSPIALTAQARNVDALFADAKRRFLEMKASPRAKSDAAFRERLQFMERLLRAVEQDDMREISELLENESKETLSSRFFQFAEGVQRGRAQNGSIQFVAGERVVLQLNRVTSAHPRLALVCDYPPGTPEDDKAPECAEGYDPNYDPTADLDSLATLTAINNGYVAIYGDSSTGPPSGGGGGGGECCGEEPELRIGSSEVATLRPRMALACNGEFWTYAGAVGAFVGSAAATVYSAAVRKNPVATWSWLKKAGAALFSVVVTSAYLADCLAE